MGLTQDQSKHQEIESKLTQKRKLRKDYWERLQVIDDETEFALMEKVDAEKRLESFRGLPPDTDRLEQKMQCAVKSLAATESQAKRLHNERKELMRMMRPSVAEIEKLEEKQANLTRIMMADGHRTSAAAGVQIAKGTNSQPASNEPGVAAAGSTTPASAGSFQTMSECASARSKILEALPQLPEEYPTVQSIVGFPIVGHGCVSDSHSGARSFIAPLVPCASGTLIPCDEPYETDQSYPLELVQNSSRNAKETDSVCSSVSSQQNSRMNEGDPPHILQFPGPSPSNILQGATVVQPAGLLEQSEPAHAKVAQGILKEATVHSLVGGESETQNSAHIADSTVSDLGTIAVAHPKCTQHPVERDHPGQPSPESDPRFPTDGFSEVLSEHLSKPTAGPMVERQQVGVEGSPRTEKAIRNARDILATSRRQLEECRRLLLKETVPDAHRTELLRSPRIRAEAGVERDQMELIMVDEAVEAASKPWDDRLAEASNQSTVSELDELATGDVSATADEEKEIAGHVALSEQADVRIFPLGYSSQTVAEASSRSASTTPVAGANPKPGGAGCSHCPSTQTGARLDEHLKGHQSVLKHKCSSCSWTSSSLASVAKHRKVHNKAPVVAAGSYAYKKRKRKASSSLGRVSLAEPLSDDDSPASRSADARGASQPMCPLPTGNCVPAEPLFHRRDRLFSPPPESQELDCAAAPDDMNVSVPGCAFLRSTSPDPAADLSVVLALLKDISARSSAANRSNLPRSSHLDTPVPTVCDSPSPTEENQLTKIWHIKHLGEDTQNERKILMILTKNPARAPGGPPRFTRAGTPRPSRVHGSEDTFDAEDAGLDDDTLEEQTATAPGDPAENVETQGKPPPALADIPVKSVLKSFFASGVSGTSKHVRFSEGDDEEDALEIRRKRKMVSGRKSRKNQKHGISPNQAENEHTASDGGMEEESEPSGNERGTSAEVPSDGDTVQLVGEREWLPREPSEEASFL